MAECSFVLHMLHLSTNMMTFVIFGCEIVFCVCTVRKVIGYCIAQYDYAATAPNQISLQEGDFIAIISKAGEATGWWKGTNSGMVILHSVKLLFFSFLRGAATD